MWNWKQLLFKEKELILKNDGKFSDCEVLLKLTRTCQGKLRTRIALNHYEMGMQHVKLKKTQQIKHKNLLIHGNQNFLLITSFWNMNKTFSRLTKFLLTMKSFTVVLIIHVNLYWKFYVRRNGNGGTWLFQNYLMITGFVIVNCEKTFSNSCSKP